MIADGQRVYWLVTRVATMPVGQFEESGTADTGYGRFKRRQIAEEPWARWFPIRSQQAFSPIYAGA